MGLGVTVDMGLGLTGDIGLGVTGDMGLGVPIFRFPGTFAISHLEMIMFSSLAKSRSPCPFGGRESKIIGKRIFVSSIV